MVFISQPLLFEIGRKSRDCKGFGICLIRQVTFTIDNHTVTFTNQSKATVKTNYESDSVDKFQLLIDDSIINDITTIFGGNQWIMEEDFILDDSHTTIMGLTKDFTIAQGNYPITYDAVKDLYIVTFNNSNI